MRNSPFYFLRYTLLPCFAAVLFLTACTKEERTVLEISPETVRLANDNQPAVITVTSNVAWNAALSGDKNINFSPSGAPAGTAEISVWAAPNVTSEEREAKIAVSGAEQTKIITITQSPVSFSVAPQTLRFDRTGGSQTLQITGTPAWEIDRTQLPGWVASVEPLSGTGDAAVTVTVNEQNTDWSKRSGLLKIGYAGTFATVSVEQQGLNGSPSAPVVRYPAHGSRNISLLPEFRWEPSSDPDGDNLTYTIYLSTDRQHWNSLGESAFSGLYPETALEPGTAYFLKIGAADPDGEETYSEIINFTTGERDAYADGGYRLYGQASKKSRPAYLIITGDGYLPQHFKYGDLFDRNADEGIEAFFAVEPYKSYREYFTVYKLAAYSKETGISDKASDIYKSTAFSCTMDDARNSTAITCNEAKVFLYAQNIPDITETVLCRSSIAVIINYNGYGGTCSMWNNGKNIAMIPVSQVQQPGYTSMKNFRNIMSHECGGHGWGRLADEYIVHQTALPQAQKNQLSLWQSFGYYLNLSLTQNFAQVPWNYLIGENGYEQVGAFEGGFLYSYGVYRPELISCMDDNRLYYNAQSRYLIVKRILETAGEPFTLEGFIAKDVQKTPPQSVQTRSLVNVPYRFQPLAPPQLHIVK